MEGRTITVQELAAGGRMPAQQATPQALVDFKVAQPKAALPSYMPPTEAAIIDPKNFINAQSEIVTTRIRNTSNTDKVMYIGTYLSVPGAYVGLGQPSNANNTPECIDDGGASLAFLATVNQRIMYKNRVIKSISIFAPSNEGIRSERVNTFMLDLNADTCRETGKFAVSWNELNCTIHEKVAPVSDEYGVAINLPAGCDFKLEIEFLLKELPAFKMEGTL